jgi:hypothetical protein
VRGELAFTERAGKEASLIGPTFDLDDIGAGKLRFVKQHARESTTFVRRSSLARVA